MQDLNNIIKNMDVKPVYFQNGNKIIKKEIAETVVFVHFDPESDSNNVRTGTKLVEEIKQEIKREMEHYCIKEEINTSVTNENFDLFNKPMDRESIRDVNSNQYENDLENKTADDQILHENHIIKEEIVIGPETNSNINQSIDKDFKNNFTKNAMVIIKDEVIDPEIHEDVYFKNKISNHAQDLYRDHIIKEEIAIGPEIVQKVAQNYVPKHSHKTRKSYIRKYENRKHIYICEYCQMTFNCSEDIREHVKQHDSHESSAMSTSSLERYHCHICNKSYEAKHNLTRHCLKVHSSDTPDDKNIYSCDRCNKKYTSERSLHRHVNSSCSFTTFKHKCKVCGKYFTNPGNLSRHMKIHLGTKPHCCDQCKLTFGRKDYLSFHIQKHHSGKLPGQKDLICELCNKGLSSKCTLTYHIKFTCPMNKDKTKPIRDKRYTCDVCLRSYPYRTSLSAHIMRRHTKTVLPTHKCDICGQKYLKKHNLQCHMLSKHMNKKPYPCSKCSESFTWQSTLTTHERKLHGREPPKRQIKSESLENV